MCGIVGIWDFKNKIDKGLLIKMRDVLYRRGPDNFGLFMDNRYNVGLGNRRLAIIDLSDSGHQPMEIDGMVITYNGEIYNFQEIKKELTDLGQQFFSNSDTEVILRAYKKWGARAVYKFRGMFAFAIWNKNDRKMILCRDRAGIKPLYYYFDGRLFVFASEIKSIIQHPLIKKEINPESLAMFLQLGYIIAPNTIFKNIHKLTPGCILEIDNKGNIKINKYWDIIECFSKEFATELRGYGEDDLIEALEKILIESFNFSMVSDVSVGLFLSGGIDSSLVASLLQRNTQHKLKTFTISFSEKKYNEAEHAKKIAEYLGTEHYEFLCSPKDAIETLPLIAQIYDEPFADSSFIPTFLVSKYARKEVKVALSADGGDEIFCGYNHYQNIDQILRLLNKIPYNLLCPIGRTSEFLSGAILKKARLGKYASKGIKLNQIALARENFIKMYFTAHSCWFNPEIKQLMIGYEEKQNWTESFAEDLARLKDLTSIQKMQVIDFKSYLCDDILTKVDRATMYQGMEGREPFLDHKIVEFASALPFDMKYRKGEKKYILKKILKKYLPEELFDRPKHGFSAPINSWLKKELKPFLLAHINQKKILAEGIFDVKIVMNELEDYLTGKVGYNRIWNILVFEMWKEEWL